MPSTLTVGAVVARSGRLSELGSPLLFVMDLLAPKLRRIGGREVRLVSRDSRSEPGRAREATRELIRDEHADVVVTLAGTRVLPAVADTCEEMATPCISSTFPWQVYYYGRGATADRPFRWTYHFSWGIDDIAETFAEMWEVLGREQRVGCVWNDGPQGSWTRDRFVPTAVERGHEVIVPAGYREPAADFHRHITELLAGGAQIVTSTATSADLALFHEQAVQRGLRPRLITCSRWLAYPFQGSLADAKVATIVYWTPRHPYRSSLDGMRADELAEAYEQRTGRQWLQPLGLAYALFEVAAHCLASADDPTDPGSVAAAIGSARLETIAGTLDWTRGPVLNVATVPLVGGQWQPSGRHPHDLAIVSNARRPDLPLDADLEPLN
ncbi:amino acid/amide ABC transporter substrate-binding protein, HAAT family (TC 3.A.1.4.-) [Saccharopolyspora kobensis]|uniref:Amino acid/amide ABC transporter substrate-binding protein, HAAT family n=1 Tax=Saccharopolyspora kobensis TaxID=146035 RepID=A0A1H6D2U5_9PSEU|nr:ABC transporter substrate-binding protein [Saccharopolyspora kobensis]SEG79364.1 amino acid/amide ABC transporter substrate-binding protein, HAAT family (TC 3.A.1.4.-) [Saccharopolyspora kobensis]SFD08005.1 amino acid/amide ABC transporter substrate-binding protein, HAAT family [Saccharopolyspora kobensis]